ncbi:MAG: DUF1002 domain-containing protein [Lachnospiraceae bacterium]|jgi:uncharacterized protein YpuA (DUF1002 family)|nr:DUF1002 domain-containing protein [Lachnospiraceae bacterium]
MKRLTQLLTGILTLALTLACFSLPAMADAAAGDTVAILGEDLDDEERSALLSQFGATEQTVLLTISNAEEHEALDALIPSGQIGTKAISSVMITYKEPGSGLRIQMNHITYVTPQSYADALTTLGITDADILVSAPFDVSGTAALTGIMKGFEKLTGQTIDEDVKAAVNEEALVSTDLSQELAENQGDPNAQETVSDIISDIKLEISEKNPQTTEEVEAIIREVLQKHGITISDELFQRLVSLFDKMKDLDIDWKQVAKSIETNANQLFNDLIQGAQSEEARSFFQKIGDWFADLWAQIKSWFS